MDYHGSREIKSWLLVVAFGSSALVFYNVPNYKRRTAMAAGQLKEMEKKYGKDKISKQS